MNGNRFTHGATVVSGLSKQLQHVVSSTCDQSMWARHMCSVFGQVRVARGRYVSHLPYRHHQHECELRFACNVQATRGRVETRNTTYSGPTHARAQRGTTRRVESDFTDDTLAVRVDGGKSEGGEGGIGKAGAGDGRERHTSVGHLVAFRY